MSAEQSWSERPWNASPDAWERVYRRWLERKRKTAAPAREALRGRHCLLLFASSGCVGRNGAGAA